MKTETPYRVSVNKIDIYAGNDLIMSASTLHRNMDTVEETAAFIVQACNNYDKLLLVANSFSKLLDAHILETPTGELRNEYCDMNISVKQLLLTLK